ncbi:alpha-1,4-glucan--maltose-1-phosphate maltosyltransferase [Georgenia sp. 311]|uniref:Alpha-1,4-glucan:maltose-1-phosphate maltosyltransferase n=1 Tax=Georgenia wutianyii TaxID=2585135 RepID=A0ABX5VPR4_9MICO|nr:alpha-1,4-glucan--maltose-1-phosphate maltosyltransferase [Georgenia sp. 311]QDB80038.1 alpha-1,4-glucan--maltose-1-phosphate maltosyltransferase [Georgenia wutianyii]TNC19805.1 alpha-1,4-glucan--maltose-1-phosphate maltosyltransferase [Georgenia sp. 311]
MSPARTTPSRPSPAPSPLAASGEPPRPASPTPIGRIPVIEVSPVVEGGRWPAKAVSGEAVRVRATVFREGHDAVAATAVLVRPDGTDHTAVTMTPVDPGLDHMEAWLVPDSEGDWSFRVEGWSDPYGTWLHDAPLKVDAGVDVELMLTEGALLLERAAARADLPPGDVAVLTDAVAGLRDASRPAPARLVAGTSPEVRAVLAAHPVREYVTPSATYRLRVDRPLALTGSWYEFFPRSEGAYFDQESGSWVSGTLRTAAERLPAIAEMGFDVVYLTPVHPIGTTNRKGRNNTLTAEPGDPGSPYGIGAPEGGHDAIHPELGTFADFDAFVARARSLGMEVALDIALQASPDHPWVTEHPEWFTRRADGTIAYAENPPKKYQDIYPLNFDNDPEGIYQAVRDMLQVWIDHGVTAFRVDNPHTKPLSFWERILTDVRASHPEVVFLSEAFTRPAMMRTLAAIGFHQSYTYFTWRTTKKEVGSYLLEVSNETSDVLRPSFWPTTHDILTPYMQTGGAAAFAIRAVLAATGSPTWGIYSGYELVENVARPGAEEQIDNEKYEFKPRDWARAQETGIAALLTALNGIRRGHPALQRLRGLTVHPTSDDATICFSRHLPAHLSPTGQDDTVVVVLNLDPFSTREGTIELDLSALGLPEPSQGSDPGTPLLTARDELSGQTFLWGRTPYVRLDPNHNCAHVLAVKPL